MKELLAPFLKTKCIFALSVFLLILGCYDVPFVLGPVTESTVDPALLGTWSRPASAAHRGAKLVIRQGSTHTYRGTISDNATGNHDFEVHVTTLGNLKIGQARDIANKDSYTLFSYLLKDEKTLEILLFRATLPAVASADELRAMVLEHADNPSMLFEGPMTFHRSLGLPQTE